MLSGTSATDSSRLRAETMMVSSSCPSGASATSAVCAAPIRGDPSPTMSQASAPTTASVWIHCCPVRFGRPCRPYVSVPINSCRMMPCPFISKCVELQQKSLPYDSLRNRIEKSVDDIGYLARLFPHRIVAKAIEYLHGSRGQRRLQSLEVV